MKGGKFVNRRRSSRPAPRVIYGVHPVWEWVRRHPEQIQALHVDAPAQRRLRALLADAAKHNLPVSISESRALATLADTTKHQGIVATATPFLYTPLSQLPQENSSVLVAVDQLQDPHNLGAIIRSATAVGAAGVLVPKDGAVGVTATVEAAAAGTTAIMPICRVTNLNRAMQTLKEDGYWSMGLVPQGGTDLYAFHPPPRVIVLIGGETGLRPLVQKNCDVQVSIPMFGPAESLNASVATAVTLYEIRRQWTAADASSR